MVGKEPLHKPIIAFDLPVVVNVAEVAIFTIMLLHNLQPQTLPLQQPRETPLIVDTPEAQALPRPTAATVTTLAPIKEKTPGVQEVTVANTLMPHGVNF